MDLFEWALLTGALYVLIKAAVPGSSPSLQALAQAIAGAEGFGVAGAIPTTHNNPGDLTDGQGNILSYPTASAGWQALYGFLQQVGSGAAPNPAYYPSMTLSQFAQVYTATQQSAWLNNVVAFLNQQGYPATDDSPVSQFLS